MRDRNMGDWRRIADAHLIPQCFPSDSNTITTITLEQATALGKQRSGLQDCDLSLNGLTSVSVDVAKQLSRARGILSLDGLTSLSVDVAEVLARRSGGLSLNGIRMLSEAVARALGGREEDRCWDDDELCAEGSRQTLVLDGLTMLSPEVAGVLSKRTGETYLRGLKSLSDEVAVTLASHAGCLHLSGRAEDYVDMLRAQPPVTESEAQEDPFSGDKMIEPPPFESDSWDE